jgi:predicted permease
VRALRELYLFVAFMAAGYASRAVLEGVLKRSDLYKATLRALVYVIFNALIPLAFFTIFLGRGVKSLDAYTILYFAAFMAIAHLSLKRLARSGDPALEYLSIFPNSVFLGFPLVYTLLGRIYVAAVFGTLTVALNVILPEATYRGGWAAIKQLARSTALLGSLAGIIAHYSLGGVASALYSALAWSPPLLSYTATFTMGFRIPLELSGVKCLYRELALVGAYRFVVAPLLAYAITLIAGFSELDRLELVVVSMTPPAVMNVVVAERFGWRAQEAALILAVLTVFFLLVVFPALVALIKP